MLAMDRNLRLDRVIDPLPADGSNTSRHDPRFSRLMGNAAWRCLPPAIRARFGRRLGTVSAVTYVGEIVDSGMTRSGWLLAQLCRLIGSPLPLNADRAVPAVVVVTKDPAHGGQFWTRVYGRPRGFPQVVQSSKRFAGPTGLEEYLGLGFGMALVVKADPQTLCFESDHYFLALGPWRWRLPRVLEPGELTITHIDRDDGWFVFELVLRHPLFGVMIRQTGLFRERLPHEDLENGHD